MRTQRNEYNIGCEARNKNMGDERTMNEGDIKGYGVRPTNREISGFSGFSLMSQVTHPDVHPTSSTRPQDMRAGMQTCIRVLYNMALSHLMYLRKVALGSDIRGYGVRSANREISGFRGV